MLPDIPAKLPDARLFLKHILALFPLWLVAVTCIILGPTVDPTMLWTERGLGVIGKAIVCYGLMLAAWEGVHLPRATAKLEECRQAFHALENAFASRMELEPQGSALLLDKIGTIRPEIERVYQGAEVVRTVRQPMNSAAFLFAAAGSIVELVAPVLHRV